MADTSDIDAALIAKLQADAQLATLAPDGVWFNRALKSGSKKFVIVALIDPGDEGTFGGRAIEDKLYLVEYRELMTSTATGNSGKAAAARIDAALENQPLTVAGYTWMATFREKPTREDEPDDVDASINWHRRGGEYRVQMSVGT